MAFHPLHPSDRLAGSPAQVPLPAYERAGPLSLKGLLPS